MFSTTRAAEAVTDGADALGIDRGLLGELVPRGVEALLHRLRVLHHRTRERTGVLRVVGGLGVAVHVGNEGCVALLRELLRLFVDVRGDAPPFMHHDDPGPLGRDGVIVHDEALHGGLAVRIGDGHFLDRGVCVRDHCDGAERAHHYRSHADLPRSWYSYIGMARIPTPGCVAASQ